MTSQEQKKKPIKLQWEGGLLESTEREAVPLKSKLMPLPKEKAVPKKIIGSVAIRVEKKGRAGSPVSILHHFSDPESRNKESLKSLCSELKTKLACGGTVENGEIVLMVRDVEKLKNVLRCDFNLKL